MSVEAWGSPGDDLNDYDPTRPWPLQYSTIDGTDHLVPSERNYTYGNRSLPAARHRDELVDAYLNHSIMVLAGDTGSGKTTQAVQAFYETGATSKVVQTQPRILLARNACYRVRQEMAYVHGEANSADTLVGYATGNDSDTHKDNEIVVATHGKALRWIVNHLDEYKGATLMSDEFHLREFEADLLTALCVKNGIKLVLSSATMDTKRISEMYPQQNGDPAPIVQIKNRPFEIEEIEGDDLIEDISLHAPRQDTMIFVTGRKNIDGVLGKSVRKMTKSTNAMALHGEQTKAQQQQVFDKSHGVRTIFSTNVGEMGVTPDVDLVINPGYERAPILIDGIPTLTERPASRAKNRQRAGRTGRTRPGKVIFGSKMEGYPKLPPLEQLAEFDAPDIQTTRIDGGLLQLAVQGETLYSLPLPDRPEHSEVERAQARLRKYGAFDKDNQLTEIGIKMSHLPVDPSFARTFIESERYETEHPLLRVKMAALAAIQQTNGIVTTNKGLEGWRSVMPNDSLSDPMYALSVFVWASDPLRTEEEWQRKGVVESKFKRAKELFATICEAEELDPRTLQPFIHNSEKEAAVACLIAGAEEVFVRAGKEAYIDARGEKRHVQQTSMAGRSSLLIGNPWNLQTYRKELLHTNRYIISPTVVTREQLIKYAPERCTYDISGYAMDEWGNITGKQALYFDGVFVDDSGRVEVESSEALRDYMVEVLFNKSMIGKKELPQNVASFCKQVAEIRYQEHKIDFDLEIEKRLTSLVGRMKQEIPTSVRTLQEIDSLLDPALLDQIIDVDKYSEIQRTSPDMITIAAAEGEQISIPVEYYQNQVRLCFTQEQLDYMPESFPEFGERDVKVKINGRSKLLTVEQAFDRALHPNRAHWRNTPREEQNIAKIKRPKDADWDGSSVRIVHETDLPPSNLSTYRYRKTP